ncbi:hypothetical protein U1Q18_050279 [Sarracenia purpurea var. burkii]
MFRSNFFFSSQAFISIDHKSQSSVIVECLPRGCHSRLPGCRLLPPCPVATRHLDLARQAPSRPRAPSIVSVSVSVLSETLRPGPVV